MTILKAFLKHIGEGVELTDGINLGQLIGATEYWQNPVIDQVNFVTSEPVAPSVGDRYINTATGNSSITVTPVTANNIYEWDGTGWVEKPAQDGFSTYDQSINAICSFNGTAWVCEVAPQYTTTYHVASTLDSSSDSNTGLYESTAFSTLGAALDAVEAGAVPAAIIIHDNATYTVTESSGTPGIRDLGVAVTIHFPCATIIGQAGGVIFETNGDIFKGKEMNGALLEMRAKNLTSTTLSHFVLQNLYEPNWFFTQEPGSGGSTGKVQVFVGNVSDHTNSHPGGIADYRTNRQGVFRMITENITLILNDAARTYDFAMQGSNSAMSLQIFNNDTKNNGAGDHVNTLCTSGGRIYYRAECIGSSPFAVAENNGAGSDIYIHASDASDGGPLNYIGTNPAGIHDWSWQEGMNFAKLPANSGLNLADIIDIRDVSGTGGDGQQVQATLSQLQVAIGATQYTEKYEAATASPTLASTWQTHTIPGATANTKVDILVERGGQTDVGVRAVGSALARTYDMRESSIITVNTNAAGQVQIFASNIATTFRLIGEHI